MIEPRFATGQRVKIIKLIDGFGRPDPRVKEFIGKIGEVVKAYHVSGDEVWEKTLKFEDTYCYDVKLDGGGDVARGIPEVGLEASIFEQD
jgi:hypothetical protein